MLNPLPWKIVQPTDEEMEHVSQLACSALEKEFPRQSFVGVKFFKDVMYFANSWEYKINMSTPDPRYPVPQEDLKITVTNNIWDNRRALFIEITIPKVDPNASLYLGFTRDDVLRHVNYKYPEYRGNNMFLFLGKTFVFTGPFDDGILSLTCQTISMLVVRHVISAYTDCLPPRELV